MIKKAGFRLTFYSHCDRLQQTADYAELHVVLRARGEELLLSLTVMFMYVIVIVCCRLCRVTHRFTCQRRGIDVKSNGDVHVCHCDRLLQTMLSYVELHVVLLARGEE